MTEKVVEARKLWEADHPYYATEGSYSLAGEHQEYPDWPNFFQHMGDSDPDMNLVYRFDWRGPSAKAAKKERGDETYGDEDDWGYATDTMLIYFMGQRKARCWSAEFPVTREEEPAVRAWLADRFKTIMAIWEPISSAVIPDQQQENEE